MNKQLNPQDASTFSIYWDSMFATTTTKIPIRFCYLAFEHFCNVCFIVGDFGKLEYAWKNENPLPLPRPTFEEKFQELLELHKALPKLKDKVKTVLDKKSLKFPQYGSKVNPEISESELGKTTQILNKDSDILILIPEKKEELNLCELLKSQIGKPVYHILFGEVIIQKIYDNVLVIRSPSALKIYEDVLTADGKSKHTGELILFPSKDQRDWSKFNPCQFADGELVWVRDPSPYLEWKAMYHTGQLNSKGKDLCYRNQKKLAGDVAVWENCVKFDQRPF